MSTHTPGPWEVGEYNEHLGYDCMTAGVRAGPAVLDGSDYGQKRCREMSDDAKGRMLADARLIAAAPELVDALKLFLKEYVQLVESGDAGFWDPEDEEKVKQARAALSKAGVA